MKKLNLLFAFVLIVQCAFAQLAPAFQVEIIGASEKHIIMIPGFSCSGDVWQSTVSQLSETHTCHILTMAGFADAPTSGDADWSNWKSHIADYIEQKEFKKASVIGHSLGGMMALELASSYPALIEEIIVVDALPSLAALQNPTFKSDENLDCSASIDMMINQSAEQFEMMQRANVAYMSASTENHDEIVSWALQSDRATLGKIFCELSNLDLRSQLGQVKCPTLVLLEAPFAPMEKLIAEQYKSLEGVQLNFAPKGLHFVMYDAPEWYAQQLTDYFSAK